MTDLTDQDLIGRCKFLIKDFTQNGFRSGEWTMRIPAEPNRDPDLVFSELIRRFADKINQPVEDQEAEIDGKG